MSGPPWHGRVDHVRRVPAGRARRRLVGLAVEHLADGARDFGRRRPGRVQARGRDLAHDGFLTIENASPSLERWSPRLLLNGAYDRRMASYRTIPLDAIVVGERFLGGLSDIDSLAASITALGLIQPLAVDSRAP
jgi:hypothetical protein